MSAKNGHLLYFFYNALVTVDAVVFGSALWPLSVNIVLFTVTGAISLVIVIVHTNGSVDTNGCYNALYRQNLPSGFTSVNVLM